METHRVCITNIHIKRRCFNALDAALCDYTKICIFPKNSCSKCILEEKHTELNFEMQSNYSRERILEEIQIKVLLES